MNLPLPALPFPRRIVRGWLGLCMLLPLPALAGTVYQCTGPGGQIAFTSQTSGYHHCRKVGHYADTDARASAPKATAGAHSEYRSEPPAANSGASTAASAGKPAKARVRRGAVYKITRAGGVTEYTNIRPRHGRYHVLFSYISTCYACDVHSNIDWDSTPLNTDAYRKQIAAAARQYGVDPALLRAVIHAESAFNPNALSDKGAQGLMQLMPDTASDLGVDDPFDAGQNIRGGAQYLAKLLREFHGDERLATAAYNAGPQSVEKYAGVPPYDQTRVYVERVATLHERYRDAGGSARPVAAAAPANAPRS